MTTKPLLREDILRQSSKSFLDESERELNANSTSSISARNKQPMPTPCGCLLRTMCLMNAILVFVYAVSPACGMDISWDSTILDIETHSVTRTVNVEVKNLNWYDNTIKDLTVEEYVRTCYGCDWELVEKYEQVGDLVMEGYEPEQIELRSVQQGIDVERVYKNKIENVYCDMREPYELSMTGYAPEADRDLSIDAEILADDRIEQIKNNIFGPKPDKRVGTVRGSRRSLE